MLTLKWCQIGGESGYERWSWAGHDRQPRNSVRRQQLWQQWMPGEFLLVEDCEQKSTGSVSGPCSTSRDGGRASQRKVSLLNLKFWAVTWKVGRLLGLGREKTHPICNYSSSSLLIAILVGFESGDACDPLWISDLKKGELNHWYDRWSIVKICECRAATRMTVSLPSAPGVTVSLPPARWTHNFRSGDYLLIKKVWSLFSCSVWHRWLLVKLWLWSSLASLSSHPLPSGSSQVIL